MQYKGFIVVITSAGASVIDKDGNWHNFSTEDEAIAWIDENTED